MFDNDLFWMGKALDLARQAEAQGEVPVGAVLISGNEIIGAGFNQPIQSNDPTAHAEIIALREAGKKVANYRLLNTTMYVTLEPCAMCVGAMLHARIARLVFGASDPKFGAVMSILRFLDAKELNHRIEYSSGLMADISGKLLVEFFQKRR